MLEFALDAAALADIAAAAGNHLSIGGTLTTDDGNDMLFELSQDGGVQQLVVEVVPEPSTVVLLLLGLIGLARARRA